MRRLLLISLTVIPLTGCQFFNRDGNTVVDIVESVESGEALDGISGPQIGGGDKPAAETEAFQDPVIASKPTAVVSADLIPSTDPSKRANAVSRSRVDPFASLPIPPTPDPVVVPPVTAGSGSATNVSSSSSARVSGTRSGGSAAVNARRVPTPPPVRVQPPNTPLVLPTPIARLPTIPQPVIAQTISVSGVIQMGNEPYAIVRAGNEPERYVRVGDRIAGGSVRVKRIETSAFEPRVILEENGIEVARPITAESTGGGSGSGDTTPEAGGPVASAPNALAVPNAPVPVTTVPGILPVVPRFVPTSTSSLQPGMENIPNSWLQPSDEAFQAVIPNFQVPV